MFSKSFDYLLLLFCIFCFLEKVVFSAESSKEKYCFKFNNYEYERKQKNVIQGVGFHIDVNLVVQIILQIEKKV